MSATGLPAALTNDKIRNLYANRRKKGLYLDLLHNFLAMNIAGVGARETWPTEFPVVTIDEDGEKSGKQVTSIKQGFDNAKEKKDAPEGADKVDVIVDGDEVYLINRGIYNPDEVEAEVEVPDVEAATV
jgi:hypothetical protein